MWMNSLGFVVLMQGTHFHDFFCKVSVGNLEDHRGEDPESWTCITSMPTGPR